MPTASTSPPPRSPPRPPTDADAADAIAHLADTAGHASTALFNYRRQTPTPADADQAQNLETTLDKRAIDLRTQAVNLLGAQAAEALAQLKGAAAKVDAFFIDVKKTEDQLEIASAVIALAAAALVGDTGGILAAVGGVYSALQPSKS